MTGQRRVDTLLKTESRSMTVRQARSIRAERSGSRSRNGGRYQCTAKAKTDQYQVTQPRRLLALSAICGSRTKQKARG